MSEVRAGERSATRSSFFANLNIFIPLFTFWAVVVGPYIALAFENLASMLFQRFGLVVVHLDVVAYMLTAFVIICLLAFRWNREGLSPIIRNSDEKAYRLGHALVAIGNIVVPVAVAVPFFFAFFKGNPELTQLEWFAIPAIAVGAILWLVGVQKVKRSRA